MRHTVRLFAIGLVVLALGCVTVGDREAADREQISRARSWAFLRNDPPIDLPAAADTLRSTYRVTSPLRDADALDADIARYIESALETLGFERVEVEADFYVNYKLILQPRAELVEGNFSSRYLASLSHSASYIIESTEINRKDYEDLNFSIDLREPRGRTLWRSEIAVRLKAFGALELQGKVDALLARLPLSSVR